MKSFIVLLVMSCSITLSAQREGVHVGNGGGFSEYNLQIAYQSYGKWLQHMKTNDKSISEPELKLLKQLSSACALETGGLIFGEKYNALLFSEPQVGSPIYVNSVLLQQHTDVLMRDLLLSEAYGMILEEVAQHIVDPLNGLDQSSLSSLIQKIKTTTKRSILSSVASYQQKVLMQSYSWSNEARQDQLILSSGYTPTLDLSTLIRNEVDCENQDLKSLKVLEPSFVVTTTDQNDFNIQMNFYVKSTCGHQRSIHEMSTRLFLNATEFKLMSVSSRLLL